jgi:hypothetical protein
VGGAFKTKGVLRDILCSVCDRLDAVSRGQLISRQSMDFRLIVFSPGNSPRENRPPSSENASRRDLPWRSAVHCGSAETVLRIDALTLNRSSVCGDKTPGDFDGNFHFEVGYIAFA